MIISETRVLKATLSGDDVKAAALSLAKKQGSVVDANVVSSTVTIETDGSVVVEVVHGDAPAAGSAPGAGGLSFTKP